MTTRLPDVALTELSAQDMPLAWVGMAGIALPLRLTEQAAGAVLAARAEVAVDLPRGDVKGIHMSRLHALLDDFSANETLNPASLDALLAAMIASHQDCGTTAARLRLTADVLRRRHALLTAGIGGWHRYPFQIEATRTGKDWHLSLAVQVLYASTCPCSAALVRQHLRDAFVAEYAHATPTVEAVADWLSHNGTLATPHSQRSEAHVHVTIPHDRTDLGLFALIDCIEQAVATPVQTAVKRADEQAFAKLNGQNLMYVEDAVRRIAAALQPAFPDFRLAVRHLESLHAHDAIAEVERKSAAEDAHER